MSMALANSYKQSDISFQHSAISIQLEKSEIRSTKLELITNNQDTNFKQIPNINNQ